MPTTTVIDPRPAPRVLAAVLPWLTLACTSPEADELASTSLGTAGSSPTSTEPGTSTEAESTGDPGDKLDVAPGGDMPSITDGGDGCEQDVDIVFVMDVSTTMGPFLDQLATEIIFVDEALDALQLPSEPHYGLVVFVDDAALLNAGAPYDSVATLQQDFMTWSGFTASNQQVGGGNSNSTWPENSLDALVLAASGFQWRPAETTLRLVIHTTDDTFWDGPTTANGVMIQNGYAQTVSALQQQQIRTFSFADTIGGSCACEDVSAGWFTPYMGMAPIPEATAGEVFDIGQVLVGAVSLADALENAVETTMCEPYPPVG
ncbi:MAG: vWA domain-containing protein [Nannocystaceae bacterium]